MNTFDSTEYRKISPTIPTSSEVVIVKKDIYYSKKGIIIPQECQSFKHELHDMEEFKWKLLGAFMDSNVYNQSSRRFNGILLEIEYFTAWDLVNMFHGNKGDSMDGIYESGIIRKEGNWGFFTNNYDYALHNYANDRPDFVISARFRHGTQYLKLESIPKFCTGKNHETDYYLLNRLSYGIIQAVTIDRSDMMGTVTQIFDPGCVEYENRMVAPKYRPSKEECDAIFAEFEAYAEIIERNPVLKAYL